MALFYSAEAGSAWSLLYPEYAVVMPQPPIALPVSYPMARGDRELVDYVNALIELKRATAPLKNFITIGSWDDSRDRQATPLVGDSQPAALGGLEQITMRL